MFTERHLPAQILLALAKNDSTPSDVRREIIELMIEKGFKEVNDPELKFLVAEIRGYKQERQEIKEMLIAAMAEEEQPPTEKLIEAMKPSTLKASFTTNNQMQDEREDKDSLSGQKGE